MADPSTIDLARLRSDNVVGAGGAGMSAIATVLAEMGKRVTGSDLKDSAALRRLEAVGVEVHVGHGPDRVGDVDAIAISTAVAPTNPEVVAARARGIPVLRRAELLAAICATRQTVAVAGTHGKTTTSSMLALMLVEGGVHPSFLVGGDLNEVGGGAVWDGAHPEAPFVVEADEDLDPHRLQPPEGGGVLQVRAGHPLAHLRQDGRDRAHAGAASPDDMDRPQSGEVDGRRVSHGGAPR